LNYNYNLDDVNIAPVVGKLLARVYFTVESLNVHLNRIAGLHGGTNREIWYNPFVKINLDPEPQRIIKNKTPCQWKTRNPIFNTTFSVIFIKCVL